MVVYLIWFPTQISEEINSENTQDYLYPCACLPSNLHHCIHHMLLYLCWPHEKTSHNISLVIWPLGYLLVCFVFLSKENAYYTETTEMGTVHHPNTWFKHADTHGSLSNQFLLYCPYLGNIFESTGTILLELKIWILDPIFMFKCWQFYFIIIDGIGIGMLQMCIGWTGYEEIPTLNNSCCDIWLTHQKVSCYFHDFILAS